MVARSNAKSDGQPMADKRRPWLTRIAFFSVCASVLILLYMKSSQPDETILASYYREMAENISTVINSLVSKDEYGYIELEYLSLPTDCTSTPRMSSLETNLCWDTTGCIGKVCNSKGDLNIICAASIMLIGASERGTTDVIGWLTYSKAIIYDADYQMTSGWCPVTQAESSWRVAARSHKNLESKAKKHPIVNNLPTMIYQTQEHGIVHGGNKNGAVLQVRTALQHLQMVTTSETKYVLILEDPVKRVIRQMLKWKEMNVLQDLRNAPITAAYIHKKVLEQVERLNTCFRKYGPKACIYFTAPEENNMDNLLLWGMYIEYIEEGLKFISKDQLYVITLQEYRNKRYLTMIKMFEFLEIMQNSVRQPPNGYRTSDYNNRLTPWDATVELLRHFYRPFNQRLILLFRDQKWCFSAC